MAFSFTACNDGNTGHDNFGCTIYYMSDLTPQELTALGLNGYSEGGTVEYGNLNAGQKLTFLSFGLDSAKCYNFQ